MLNPRGSSYLKLPFFRGFFTAEFRNLDGNELSVCTVAASVVVSQVMLYKPFFFLLLFFIRKYIISIFRANGVKASVAKIRACNI